MKRTKKITACLTALILAAGLSACGSFSGSEAIMTEEAPAAAESASAAYDGGYSYDSYSED